MIYSQSRQASELYFPSGAGPDNYKMSFLDTLRHCISSSTSIPWWLGGRGATLTAYIHCCLRRKALKCHLTFLSLLASENKSSCYDKIGFWQGNMRALTQSRSHCHFSSQELILIQFDSVQHIHESHCDLCAAVLKQTSWRHIITATITLANHVTAPSIK